MVERDIENAGLASGSEAGPMADQIGHLITYRIAVGPRAGRKLLTLQTLPPRLQGAWGLRSRRPRIRHATGTAARGDELKMIVRSKKQGHCAGR